MSGVVGSVVGGLLGGSSGSSAAGNAVTNLPNLDQNTSNWQNLLKTNLGNDQYLQSLLPKIQGLFSSQFNNQYAPALQTGAGSAGTALTNVGNTALTNAGNVSGAGNNLLAGANQIYGQSFDPQKFLYDQSKQQAMDRANVTNSQYGLEGPYAANAVNQAQQNFDSNWSNQQLQRMIAGLQSSGSATGQGVNALDQSSNLGTAGAGNLFQGAGLPFNAFNTITGSQENAFNNLFGNTGQIQGANTQDLKSIMDYIQTALGQQSNRFNAQQQGASSGAQGGEFLGGLAGDLIGSLF